MPLADHKPTGLSGDQGPPCGTAKLLSSLNDTDRAELIDWLNDLNIGHVAISEALEREGYRLSHQQVSWHRRRKCKCFR